MNEFVDSFGFRFSYLAGAIPFGYLIVWFSKGKDLTTVESGRTGGTNVMRAAGALAGLFTGALDVLKGYSTLWIVSWLAPGMPWVSVAAALMAILGHNYSVFLIVKKDDGALRLRGGAGGATALGGAMALWPTAGAIILPLAFLVYMLIGYASVTTMSIGFTAAVIFAIRALQGLSPWDYVAYGVLALAIVLYALRPNLKRLANGTERVVGLRAYAQKKKDQKKESSSKAPRTKFSNKRQAGRI